MKSKQFSIVIFLTFSIFFILGLLWNKYNSDPIVEEQKELKKDELAFIYFGCSSCDFANNDDIIEAVTSLKSEFMESYLDLIIR